MFAGGGSETSCAVVSRNLWVGISGSDVKILQEVLNRDNRTRLAIVGPGSPGNETMYFGPVTKAAVIKFQEIYKSEVLTPVGLASGSGYVGTFTRAKILTLCKKSQVSSTTTPASTVVAPVVSSTPVAVSPSTSTPTPMQEVVEVADPNLSAAPAPAAISSQSPYAEDPTLPSITDPSVLGAPVLMYPSSYTVEIGKSIGVYGLNFASAGNTVHFDSYLFKNVASPDGSLLTIAVGKDVPLGRHDLWVSNAKGVTSKSFVIVMAPDTVPPVVTKLHPTEGNIEQ